MCGVIQSHHHSYDRLEHLGHQSAKSGFLVVKVVKETDCGLDFEYCSHQLRCSA